MSNYALPDAPNTKSLITKPALCSSGRDPISSTQAINKTSFHNRHCTFSMLKTLSNPIRPSSKEHHSRATRGGVQDNKKRGGMSKLKHNKGQNNN